MKIQKPSLGHIVIFTAWRGAGPESGKVDEYAGIVVNVRDQEKEPGVIDIATLGSSSLYHNNGVRFSADAEAGTWRYPPHVKDEIEV